MNRTIKFRAWDKEEEKIIDWQYLIDYCDIDYLFGNIEENPKRDTIPDFDVMQYTGLKDQKGVEIYEGDILYFEPYETHGNDRIVEYMDGAYRGRLIRNGYSQLLSDCVYETRVIGNVYENPELLDI